MKQKVFTFGDKFAIRDENGAEVFFVDGSVFSLGHHLSFQDRDGNELASIRQKLLAWGPTYELYKGGSHFGSVRKELFTPFHCTFHVHVDGHGDLEAAGNLTDHEYVFTRDGRTVARISKQWFAWADTYGVDVESGEDALLILASTVVIDLACHHQK